MFLLVYWLVINGIFLVLMLDWLRHSLMWEDLFIFPFINKILIDNNIDIVNRIGIYTLFVLVFLPALVFYFLLFGTLIILTASVVLVVEFIRKLLKK